MTASFVAYIDESGDEGFSFESGSPEWFVLSAVVVRKAHDVETVKLVDLVRQKLDRPERKPLHFRDLKHEQRLPFVDQIAKATLRTITVLVHKPSLNEPERFAERYRLYFYAVRYLLERLSWYCRDHRATGDTGDGTVEMVFSNRSGMAYDDMRTYLERLKARTNIFEVRIEWTVIDPGKLTAYTPGKRMGLQIADAVAGSFFYAVQSSRHGFTEERYARMLKPVVYHRRGRCIGYGIKFWPREVHELVRTAPQLEWARTEYR